MSKRDGALGVDEYENLGYLPQAIFNYLLKLGWSYNDEEIISGVRAIDVFDLKDVNKSPARFDLDKLKDLFDSNRIRLRHEKVNGAIMITAQPEEIQKFLISYSKDETVFEKPDYYVRVGS